MLKQQRSQLSEGWGIQRVANEEHHRRFRSAMQSGKPFEPRELVPNSRSIGDWNLGGDLTAALFGQRGQWVLGGSRSREELSGKLIQVIFK